MRFDRLVGVYHFLSDRAPQDVPVASPRPRRPNPYRSNGKVLVSRMSATADLKASIEAALAKLGGLDKVIGRNDKVLVKPNTVHLSILTLGEVFLRHDRELDRERM